jgi:uncharacterized protein with HEPN domain
MRSKAARSPRGALRDILENLRLARELTGDLGYEAFSRDRRTVYAVTRCFEIVSEASRRLPDEMKARHPEVPWRDIAGAGKIYRNDYEDVLEPILWRTLEHSSKVLRVAVESELARLPEE